MDSIPPPLAPSTAIQKCPSAPNIPHASRVTVPSMTITPASATNSASLDGNNGPGGTGGGEGGSEAAANRSRNSSTDFTDYGIAYRVLTPSMFR